MKVTIVSKKDYPEFAKLKRNFKIVKSGDIFIALGGDGTFIKAAGMTDKPVLLIRDENSGGVGISLTLN